MQTQRGWKYPTSTPSGSGGLALFDNMALLVARVPKHNFTATRNPLTTDDLTGEYYPGSTWINTINNTVWQCTHNTTSAATWVNTLQSSGTGWSIDDMGNADFASISGTVTIVATSSMGTPTLTVDSILPNSPGDIMLTGNLNVSGTLSGTFDVSGLYGTISPTNLGTGTHSSSYFLDGSSAYRLLSSADIPDLSGSYVTTSSLSSTLSSYVLSSVLSGYQTVGDYATHSDLSSYVSTASLGSTLGSYRLTATAITESEVTNLIADLALKAALASPTFTGSMIVGSASTGTNAIVTVGDGTGIASDRLLSYGSAACVHSMFVVGSCEGFWSQTSNAMCLGTSGGLADFTEATLIANAALVISPSNGVSFPNSMGIGSTYPPDTGLMLRNKDIGLEGSDLSNNAVMGKLQWGPRSNSSYPDSYSAFPVQITGNLAASGGWYSSATLRVLIAPDGDITGASPIEEFRVSSAGTLTPGDTEMTNNAKGIILKSPDSTRYRVTVANGGTLTVTAI